MRNLIDYGYTGAVYPINPHAKAVRSVPCYPSVRDLPAAPDLAIIAVPKQHVLTAADVCGQAGVRALVVISAGFREVGGEGLVLEQRLVETVRRHGMRMVGPNCRGVLNTDPAISMNATFAPVMPPAGSFAFMSQSGALGLSVLDYAQEYGIGISQFVSVGNKPDVSGNDLLVEWEHDPAVEVILMYVENFGNPRRFLEIASRITRKKPIIALKSGRSRIGALAATSHTGALAASDYAADALLKQAGVLRAATMEELFDMAIAFGARTLPCSGRTAVLTNSGGPGILAADALAAHQLELPELSENTIRELNSVLPAEASLRNPLDMIASATPPSYSAALSALLRDPNIDAAVAIFVPPMGVRQEDVAEAVGKAAATAPGKPVLAVLMGRNGLPQGRSELRTAGVPSYIFAESAARGLAALNRQRQRVDREEAAAWPLHPDIRSARAILHQASCTRRDQIDALLAFRLLQAYGIRVAMPRWAQDADAAVRHGAEIGFPVALKTAAPDVVHKSDTGGVRLNLRTPAEVRDAFGLLADAGRDGVLVQKMLAGGVETIVGGMQDPMFGPLVMFGVGGVLVEAWGDVAFRMAPLKVGDAMELIDSIHAQQLLNGFRGGPVVNRRLLADVLLRVAQLLMDFPEVAELDINPLWAGAESVTAVDVRITQRG